jgi:O-antigen ligase
MYQFILLVVGATLILWIFPQYGVRLTSLNVIAQLFSQDSGPALAGADNSVVDRASVMLSALMVFRDHPLFGVGPGMVRYYTQDYTQQIGISSVTEDLQAHNLYLGIAADAGLLGLICFLSILFIPLRDLARARKYWMVKRPDLSYLATAFFQALVGYMVTGLFLHLSYYRFFYLILALTVVAGSFKDTQENSEVAEGAQGPLPNLA